MTDRNREELIEKAAKAIAQYERELNRKRGDESERIWGHRGAFVADFHPTTRGRAEAALAVFEQAHTPTSAVRERRNVQGEPTDAQVRAVWDALGPAVTVAFEYEELRAALRVAGGVE